MKTDEEMDRLLDEFTEEFNSDPEAQREMARLRRAEAGFPDLFPALSTLQHQIKMLEKHGVAVDFDPVTGLKSDGTRYTKDEPLRKWTVEKAEARRRIARLRQNWEDAVEKGIAAAKRQGAHTVAGDVAAEKPRRVAARPMGR